MLGGMDWDKCLSRWIDVQFSLKHNVRPSAAKSGEQFLWREAEELKHSLTSRKRVSVRAAYEGHVLQSVMTREEFEEITAHLLDRTRFTIRKLVADAGLTWIEIDKIILVGGSTRMPQVREMLLRESGMEPDYSVSADEAVAHGAAIYAATLNAKDGTELELPEPEVRDHGRQCSQPGRVRRGQEDRPLVQPCDDRRNTRLPASHANRFETIHDNQPSVAVEVIEGGDARGRHATRIGRCVVHDLPPNLPAGTPVDVEFRYDTDGLINVKASLPTCGQKADLRIDRASGLSNEERAKMMEIHLALGLDPAD